MARPKILLVDDTRLVLELEKSFLKFSEVDILTAGNGVEALEMVKKDPPDVVFMDMNMPEMDGITACSRIKADPFLSEIPVIMLTTAGREDDRERAVQAGANGYLTKPIDRHEFLEMARKYTDAVDRRLFRLPCHLPALLVIDTRPHSAHIVDISENGVFVASHHDVSKDAVVSVAFYLPGGAPLLFEGAGRVAWVNADLKRIKASLSAGFGVEFTNLEEDQAAALKAFVDADAREGRASS